MRRDVLAAESSRKVGKKSVTENSNDDVPTPRDVGRGWANELQAQSDAEGTPDSWFEKLYDRAQGRPEYIPWETAAPRFKLQEWLADHPGKGRTAIDVGCGLGDNAACLADARYKVTAFDLSETATKWAAERFATRNISFGQGDVFQLPDTWLGQFDLVHETYNLQAMPQDRLEEAIRAIAGLVSPGGTMLVMTRARDSDDVPSGPPWPLTRETLEVFSECGLQQTAFETFDDQRTSPISHFLATWTRPVG